MQCVLTPITGAPDMTANKSVVKMEQLCGMPGMFWDSDRSFFSSSSTLRMLLPAMRSF